MQKNNYVKTIYNFKERPKTEYPMKLILYFVERLGIRKGAKILDSGCGRGDFSEAFAEAGMDVYGIDATEDFDEKKYQYIGGFDLENEKLPYSDNYFDVVFSKSVLEHIHKPQNYLTEIYRVLKPGGVFICMVPDWYSQMYIYYDDFSHVQPYTLKGLYDTLRIFNFKKVRAELFYQLPVVWRYPVIKILCIILQIFGGPVRTISKNKFYRFSRELMILGVGRK